MTSLKIKNLTEHARRSEKSIEKYLTEKVKSLGGLTLKYEGVTNSGYPDRIVMLNGSLFWVELKSRGEKPRPLQAVAIENLRRQGQRVYVADSREMVDLIINRENEIHSAPLPD